MGWRRGTVGLAGKRSWVRVSASRAHGVKTLGKFLTPMCLCHQAVKVETGLGAVTPDGLEFRQAGTPGSWVCMLSPAG